MNTTSGTSGTVALSNSGTGLTWVSQQLANQASSGQKSATTIHTAVVATSAAMTATATTTGASSGAPRTSLKVYVLTGVDNTTPAGGGTSGGSATNNLTTTGFTASGNGSLIVAGGTDWNALGTATSSDLTIDTFNDATAYDGLSGFKTNVSSGASVTVNLDAFGSAAAAWTWCTQELLAAGSASPPVYVPTVAPSLAAMQRSTW